MVSVTTHLVKPEFHRVAFVDHLGWQHGLGVDDLRVWAT